MSAFQRGSSTSGCAAPGNNYPRFHRQRFIEQFGKRGLVFAKNATHMNSYDIGFTAIIQCEGSACEEENLRYGPILANVPHEMAFQYKYLADIDGNTFRYDGA